MERYVGLIFTSLYHALIERWLGHGARRRLCDGSDLDLGLLRDDGLGEGHKVGGCDGLPVVGLDDGDGFGVARDGEHGHRLEHGGFVVCGHCG